MLCNRGLSTSRGTSDDPDVLDVVRVGLHRPHAVQVIGMHGSVRVSQGIWSRRSACRQHDDECQRNVAADLSEQDAAMERVKTHEHSEVENKRSWSSAMLDRRMNARKRSHTVVDVGERYEGQDIRKGLRLCAGDNCRWSPGPTMARIYRSKESRVRIWKP